MRGAFLLLAVAVALSAPNASAYTLKCVRGEAICLIPIEVDMSTSPCTATAPVEVEVPSIDRFRATWLVFFIVGGDPSVRFAQTDAIKFDDRGDGGTRWQDEFDQPTRRHDRMVLVKDRNHRLLSKEKYKYSFTVTPCTPVDPLIHNTN